MRHATPSWILQADVSYASFLNTSPFQASEVKPLSPLYHKDKTTKLDLQHDTM